MKKMKTMNIRCYSEMINIPSFIERFRYLKLDGEVGQATFGHDRYLNQLLYHSYDWKRIRDKVIIRDDGNDLAMEGYPISSRILIHHINPITVQDILNNDHRVYDLENLICVSFKTHNAIHFGSEELIPKTFIERKRNDTCPWRK